LRKTDRTAEAEAAFRKALAIRKQLAGPVTTRAAFRQELAWAHNNLGRLLVEKKKDYTEAAKFYAVALALQKQLVADLPSVSDYQNDLATTLVNIAILHNHRREFALALALVKQARPHHEAAMKASPRNLTYRRRYHGNLRALAWSQIGLADHVHLATTADELARFDCDPPDGACHAARYLCICVRLANADAQFDAARREKLGKGYADKALALLRQAVTRGLEGAARSPRPEYRRQIASCYVDVGSLLRADRRPKEAETAYREALAIQKQLAADFPKRPDFRSELARTHRLLGDLLYDARRLKEAEAAYRDALAILKQLPGELAKGPRFRQELARCHNSLGNVLYLTGRPKEAEAAYGEALPLQKQLAADFPKAPDYQNALAGALVNIAMVRKQRREFAGAVALLEQARPHHQAALKANPKNRTYRQFYHNNLRTLAVSYLGLAAHARLATTADELARFGHDPANDTYLAACYLARCVTLAGKDAQLDEARRKELAKAYADRGLALLRQAVARGYKNTAQLKKDPDLQPLRARDDFKKLLADLERKAKE
jgi:tetratricopeptide (TPR) repeat protein